MLKDIPEMLGLGEDGVLEGEGRESTQEEQGKGKGWGLKKEGENAIR